MLLTLFTGSRDFKSAVDYLELLHARRSSRYKLNRRKYDPKPFAMSTVVNCNEGIINENQDQKCCVDVE